MDSGWWSTNPLALKCVICLLLHFTASPIFFFESNKYKCVQCSQFFSSKKPPIYFQLSELFVKDYLDLYVLTFAHKLVSPLCTHFMYICRYRSGDIYVVHIRSGMKLIGIPTSRVRTDHDDFRSDQIINHYFGDLDLI